MLPREAAGEVQTPVAGRRGARPRVGDRVWLRHTKAGELSEHLNAFAVVDGDGRRRAADLSRRGKGVPVSRALPRAIRVLVDPVPLAQLGARRALDPAFSARPTERRRGRQAVVRAARERGLTVKAIGAGHSFTAIAATDGVQLDIAAIDGAAHGRRRDGPRHARRRHPPLPAARAARAARPRAREHGRHRPADDRRRHLDRHPRHRRRFGGLATQIVGGHAGHGSRRAASRQRDRERRTAARRAASGSARWASSSRSRVQCVPAFLLHARRAPEPLRRGARHVRAACRRPTTSSSTCGRTPTR